MAAFENGTGEGNEYFRNNIIISKKIGHIWLQFLKIVFCKKKTRKTNKNIKFFIHKENKQFLFTVFYFILKSI